MKTIKRKVLVAIFIFTTFINFANNTEINNTIDAKKVKVVFNDAKKGQELIVKDKNGIVLHTEQVLKEGKLVKFFDFSNLNNGDYTLELEKDFEIIIKYFNVENNIVIFDENSKQVIFKPVVRNEASKILITKINFDKEPLKINIFFNDDVIFSETVEANSTILNRVYKLKKEEKGTYKVIIYNNGRSYMNEFDL